MSSEPVEPAEGDLQDLDVDPEDAAHVIGGDRIIIYGVTEPGDPILPCI